MPENPPSDESEVLSIKSRFVRGRNLLFAKADFSQLYVDYYLHQKDNGLSLTPEFDERLKQAIALFSLHCISRPRNDLLAWTVNFQQPLHNLFLAGDTGTGDVTGRIYTEGVKQAEENVFYQDVVRRNREPHRSIVGFNGSDLIHAVEEFYKFSEQRPARFFQLEPDVFAILAAHPDYDENWFETVTLEDVRKIEETEEVVDLETRFVRWYCGCNQDRILGALSAPFQADPEDLFLGEELIEVNCPRCAAKHRISREMMEAYVADKAK
ncbi:Hsp33 family molecular chaperone HslO [Pelagicoccus sp. SDUM812005]|uniref:Hsp33 family molecular chaperone HslO n=1 Tax=Pelagicoccus sp. SDUM812005 TaxID=3041257 RepID=UPI00280C718E|nr:Hsp33 family molecular chaperone HslO [Pelagicoccus sp. SDUM812005]MDQ8179732.1 Hsp33 family molecular chaperone HslO [Pelagicoccus sp. SDUM812005]